MSLDGRLTLRRRVASRRVSSWRGVDATTRFDVPYFVLKSAPRDCLQRLILDQHACVLVTAGWAQLLRTPPTSSRCRGSTRPPSSSNRSITRIRSSALLTCTPATTSSRRTRGINRPGHETMRGFGKARLHAANQRPRPSTADACGLEQRTRQDHSSSAGRTRFTSRGRDLALLRVRDSVSA